MARRFAFTLSELLVAVAVIAILSLLLVRAVHRVRDAAAQAQFRESHAVSARYIYPAHARGITPRAEATRVPQPAAVERRLP